MDSRAFLDFLKVAEKLKCNTRHSYTSSGRHESVAEHSWRLPADGGRVLQNTAGGCH